VGVFQLLEMTERLEQLAAEKAPRDVLERQAREEGMGSLWEDGIAKALAGLTSVEELARVCTA
jgi:general secretion pathway protein E